MKNEFTSKEIFGYISGIFGEKVALALQRVHEKNGVKFYSEVNVTELTVRC